jgi:hypothetical protein
MAWCMANSGYADRRVRSDVAQADGHKWKHVAQALSWKQKDFYWTGEDNRGLRDAGCFVGVVKHF